MRLAHASRVRFLSDGRYVPERLGDFAFIFAIIGEDGVCDAAALCRSPGLIYRVRSFTHHPVDSNPNSPGGRCLKAEGLIYFDLL